MQLRTPVIWLLSVASLSLPLVGCAGANDSSVETTVVPNVKGIAYSDAQQRLAARALRWRVEGSKVVMSAVRKDSYSTADDDTVIEQEPGAGTTVERRTVVTLKISCERPALSNTNDRCID